MREVLRPRFGFEHCMDAGIAQRVERLFAVGFALEQDAGAISSKSAYSANLDLPSMKRSEGENDLMIDFERRRIGLGRVDQDRHVTHAPK